jgi:hypothetical protein
MRDLRRSRPVRGLTSLALVLLLAIMAFAPVGAQERCSGERATMREALQKFIEANQGLQDACDNFHLALERQRAAEGALEECLAALKKSTAAWRAAIKRARACLAKHPDEKCQPEIQAARDAVKIVARDEKEVDRFAFEIGNAEMNVDLAQKAVDAAQANAEAARENYNKAAAAHSECLNSLIKK